MLEIFASLVFDSWTEPIPALRSSILQDRHLIYEGGGIILDLLVKQAANGTCLHIGGQVLPDERGMESVSDVPVLMEFGSNRSSTRTNVLGEFTFHASPSSAFNLAVILKDRRFLVRGLSSQEPRHWRVFSSPAGKVD